MLRGLLASTTLREGAARVRRLPDDVRPPPAGGLPSVFLPLRSEPIVTRVTQTFRFALNTIEGSPLALLARGPVMVRLDRARRVLHR